MLLTGGTGGDLSAGIDTNDGTGGTNGGSGGIPRLARGITKQSPRVQDRHFSGQVRGQLFATDCVSLGKKEVGVLGFGEEGGHCAGVWGRRGSVCWGLGY